jgi:hypothetical protein
MIRTRDYEPYEIVDSPIFVEVPFTEEAIRSAGEKATAANTSTGTFLGRLFEESAPTVEDGVAIVNAALQNGVGQRALNGHVPNYWGVPVSNNYRRQLKKIAAEVHRSPENVLHLVLESALAPSSSEAG